MTISKYAKAKNKNAFTFPPILLQLCPNSSSRIKNLSSTFVAVYYLLFHVIQQREESENIKLAGTSRGATTPATLYTLSTSQLHHLVAGDRRKQERPEIGCFFGVYRLFTYLCSKQMKYENTINPNI